METVIVFRIGEEEFAIDANLVVDVVRLHVPDGCNEKTARNASREDRRAVFLDLHRLMGVQKSRWTPDTRIILAEYHGVSITMRVDRVVGFINLNDDRNGSVMNTAPRGRRTLRIPLSVPEGDVLQTIDVPRLLEGTSGSRHTFR